MGILLHFQGCEYAGFRYYAAPLLIAQRRGLIVNISFYGNARVHDPAYYASKAGLDKLAAVYAEHFTPFNVAAISLWPGYVGTERMTQVMETDPGVKQLKEKMGFESTELSGRVIRALYDDPNLLTLSGKTILTAEMAEHYGISDLDGYEPKSLRGIYGGPHPAFECWQIASGTGRRTRQGRGGGILGTSLARR